MYFVNRHKGRASPWPIVIAGLVLLAIVFAIAPRSNAAGGIANVDFDTVRGVVHKRCTTCHAAAPEHPGFQAAPAGVALETDAQINAEALRIYQQTVVTRVMPIGNLTGITEDEREIIDRWYQSESHR